MATLVSPLDDLLTSTAKVRVLRALLASEVPLSGRELARKAGMTRPVVDAALRDFAALGVVRREETTAQSLISINRHHELVRRALAPLFGAEQDWTAALFAALRDLVRTAGRASGDGAVLWAGLYGSAARGEDEPDSDLDVAVLVPASRLVDRVHSALANGARDLEARFGRHVSPHVLALSQARKLARAGDALMDALQRDSRRLAGAAELGEVLGGSA